MNVNSKVGKIIMVVLCLFLLFGLGYASLQTNLRITGSTDIKGNNWNVHFSNVSIPSGSIATVDTVIIDNTNLSLSFNADLKSPGNVYSFSVDVVNSGSLDAMLDSFKMTPVSLPAYIDYKVTWANGVTPKKRDKLSANQTLKLNVSLTYKTGVADSEMPDDDVPISFEIGMKYIQATNGAIEVSLLATNFVTDSWNEIAENVSKNMQYPVGATKCIHLEGFSTTNDNGCNGDFEVRVANNTTPSECSTDGFSQAVGLL